MTRTDWKLRRRELLEGLGAGAALLPLLHATRSYGAMPTFPRRLVIVTAVNGYPPDAYEPRGAGEDLANLGFSDTMSPLEAWKRHLVFLPSLTSPTHVDLGLHELYGVMYSGVAGNEKAKNSDGYYTAQGPTVDQVVGNAIDRQVKLARRTLALGVGVSRFLGVHPNFGPAFMRCHWSGPDQPVTPDESPYRVMEDLFMGRTSGPGTAAQARAEKASMLDFLARDLERFAGRLGTEDRRRIEGHNQAIRDLEQQLTAAPPVDSCQAPKDPGGPPLDLNKNLSFPKVLDWHMDLLVAALKCDVTRVATLQLASAVADEVSPVWADVTGTNISFADQKLPPDFAGRTWHDCAHTPVGPRGDDKAKIDRWLMGRLAALLERLAAVEEIGPGSTTMLDNTVVLWGNTMWTGNHEHRLPWILGGKCGGYFATGRYVRNAGNSTANAVLTDICNAMGVPATYFGSPDHPGTLPGLKA